ncbi:MAG: hypothetical protein U1B83_08445, partial [Candidatus Cloacimonadaceae bacterium]|nr:hypothetical protein [Candidatus Cloacimonadaceae bacterium]
MSGILASAVPGFVWDQNPQALIDRARMVLSHPRFEGDLPLEFANALAVYRDLEGARLIAYLASHQGTAYLPEDLVLWLDSGGYATIYAAAEDQIPQQPVPLSDGKTLREVNRRLSILLGLRPMRHAVGEDNSRVDAEIAFLRNYLRECSRPGGIIRVAKPDDDRRHYQRLHAAVKRLQTKLRPAYPDCVELIKTHLQMG